VIEQTRRQALSEMNEVTAGAAPVLRHDPGFRFAALDPAARGPLTFVRRMSPKMARLRNFSHMQKRFRSLGQCGLDSPALFSSLDDP
jgi:hypothetical protein